MNGSERLNPYDLGEIGRAQKKLERRRKSNSKPGLSPYDGPVVKSKQGRGSL